MKKVSLQKFIVYQKKYQNFGRKCKVSEKFIKLVGRWVVGWM
jgi:hypothetical protein